MFKKLALAALTAVKKLSTQAINYAVCVDHKNPCSPNTAWDFPLSNGRELSYDM